MSHDPRKAATTRLLLIVALSLCVLGSAALGWFVGGRGQLALLAERGELRLALDQAREELEALRREVLVLARGIEIERKASNEVREEITELQEQIYAQQKEITFYRNAMSPPSGADALQVQGLLIYPAVQSGQFRFKLVLVQMSQKRSEVRGSASLAIEGVSGDSVVVLGSEKLGAEAGPLQFRFQYFQELEGVMRLPEGFQPARVKVNAVTKGRKPLRAERSFPWQVQKMGSHVG